MLHIANVHLWLVLVLCWTAISGLRGSAVATVTEMAVRGRIKVMFLFQEGGEARLQAVENVLSRAFELHGYSVLDRNIVTQILRREGDILQLYEVEAAKQLGSRLGANIVVSGSARVRSQEKYYDTLGGKKVTVSQADVEAKAILATSGRVLVAGNEHDRKPFDLTGATALEQAAEELAGKLIAGIEHFLNRDTIDYRLVILNIDHPQSQALKEALRTQRQGVRQVTEHGFVKNLLELDVSVEKQQELAFKQFVFAGLPGLGVGDFTVEAREGETIYLQRTGGKRVPKPAEKIRETPPLPPATGNKGSTTERANPQPGSTTAPVDGYTYKPGYGKSWAVVIGINNYQKWPKLDYAVNDAQEMINRLKRMGFHEVIPILDSAATQQHILHILGDELYAKTGDEDRVVIFFAGHGQTQDLPDGSKVGYIIPIDGDQKNYYSTAISMRQLQDLSNRLRAKHIFYVMDSCFSGLLLRPRGGAPTEEIYTKMTAARVRQVLTAGDAGQEVVEVGSHGLFTKVLLEGLDGKADLNGDGYITATELSRFVTPRVLQASQNAQEPAFGPLGHGGGEFVFALTH